MFIHWYPVNSIDVLCSPWPHGDFRLKMRWGMLTKCDSNVVLLQHAHKNCSFHTISHLILFVVLLSFQESSTKWWCSSTSTAWVVRLEALVSVLDCEECFLAFGGMGVAHRGTCCWWTMFFSAMCRPLTKRNKAVSISQHIYNIKIFNIIYYNIIFNIILYFIF